MAINSERIQDAYQAISFADDTRALYEQLKNMQGKITRYGTAVELVALGIAPQREVIFADLVQDVIDSADIARIGALSPTINDFIALLELDYQDFINPQ